MNTQGALCGLALATGILLIWRHLLSRRVRLDERLAPYLVEADASSRVLGPTKVLTPVGVLIRLLAPWTKEVERVLAVFSSPTAELESRLMRSGRSVTVAQFRVQQLQWAVTGLIGGLALTLVLGATRDSSVPVLITIVVFAPVGGLVLCDYSLSRDIASRTARILSEFPTIAELLALAVSAGQGPMAGLERVARSTTGELSKELLAVVSHVRSGAQLPTALEQLGARTGIPAIIRFADGVSVAVERGTPLAHVLRAQAQDARDIGHRDLMEIGGKKEVHMLLPVVFILLPITVLFAVFPSLLAFNVSF